MNIKTVWALLINTLQKEMRNKFLIFLAIFTVLVIFAIHGVVEFLRGFEGNELQMLLTTKNKSAVLLSIINIWNWILAAVLGTGCIKSDESSGVAPQLLSFPIRRVEYLTARVLGTWILTILYYLGSVIAGIVIFSSLTGDSQFGMNVLTSLAINVLVILVCICFGVFYSLFMPRIMAFFAVLFTSIMIALSNSAMDLVSYKDVFGDFTIKKMLAMIVHTILPRTSNMGSISKMVLWENEVTYNVPLELGHFFITTLFLYLLTWFILKRRDF